MIVDTALPYLGKNMHECCQRTEQARQSGARWLQCQNCSRVIVNIDGLRSAPRQVELALFDIEPTDSRKEGEQA